MAFQSEFASRGVAIVRDHGASELTNNDGIKKSDFLEGIFDGIDDFGYGVVVLWVALRRTLAVPYRRTWSSSRGPAKP